MTFIHEPWMFVGNSEKVSPGVDDLYHLLQSCVTPILQNTCSQFPPSLDGPFVLPPTLPMSKLYQYDINEAVRGSDHRCKALFA